MWFKNYMVSFCSICADLAAAKAAQSFYEFAPDSLSAQEITNQTLFKSTAHFDTQW